MPQSASMEPSSHEKLRQLLTGPHGAELVQALKQGSTSQSDRTLRDETGASGKHRPEKDLSPRSQLDHAFHGEVGIHAPSEPAIGVKAVDDPGSPTQPPTGPFSTDHSPGTTPWQDAPRKSPTRPPPPVGQRPESGVAKRVSPSNSASVGAMSPSDGTR